MTTAKPVTASASFDEQIKHARELVLEGHRLLYVAKRDLKAGRSMVRRTQQLLADANTVFRTKRRMTLSSGTSTGLSGTSHTSIPSALGQPQSSV